jgi:hypothetical protein
MLRVAVRVPLVACGVNCTGTVHDDPGAIGPLQVEEAIE